MKEIMQYQVVWTAPNGQTHRGQLNSDRSIPEAWVDAMNAKYPDIKHYVADVYPAYASRAVSKNEPNNEKESPMSVNLCSALQCPHSYKSGCNRYTVSNMCPLAQLDGVRANQYWLFVSEEPDLEAIKPQLQSEVLDTKPSQKLLHAEATLRESPAVMSW